MPGDTITSERSGILSASQIALIISNRLFFNADGEVILITRSSINCGAQFPFWITASAEGEVKRLLSIKTWALFSWITAFFAPLKSLPDRVIRSLSGPLTFRKVSIPAGAIHD